MSGDRAGDSAARAPRSLLWAGQDSGTSARTAISAPPGIGDGAGHPVQPVLGPEAFWRREFILTGPPPAKRLRMRVR
jgi:hypothetical protein